jgi:hypothetical protein
MKFKLSNMSLRRSAIPIAASACLFLTACGATSGENSLVTGTVPTFTSTPGTAATQGSAYTYQIEASPTAIAPSLTLMTAPAGAVLTGNSLTWTPTAAQSRVPNQFSVVATNTTGNATQMWNVTPAGTVTGSAIQTYWTPNGPVNVPIDWTKVALAPLALVPQLNGSFQTAQGTGNSDGTFSIPGIPGGYYWLKVGIAAYWTSSSTFDLGVDTNTAAPASVTNSTTTTGMQFNLSGLDPLQAGDEVAFFWDLWPAFALPLARGHRRVRRQRALWPWLAPISIIRSRRQLFFCSMSRSRLGP